MNSGGMGGKMLSNALPQESIKLKHLSFSEIFGDIKAKKKVPHSIQLFS